MNRYGRGQTGISLIELVMFMVIVSVGLAGILSVMNVTTKASADPMLRKQALAIAESLLEEIQQQPFTYCDPDDPLATTANGTGPNLGCTDANNVEGFGKAALQGPEARGAAAPFDNVYDYAGGSSGALGFSMAGIRPIHDVTTTVAGLESFTAKVFISSESVGEVPADASLRIDVNVTFGSNIDVTLTGYRMRYAPNAAP